MDVEICDACNIEFLFLPFSNQILSSPYSDTAESLIKRIEEMIANLRSLIVKQILLVNTEGNL